MKAIHFYDRLMTYEIDCKLSKRLCDGYEHNSVTIHRKGNEREWYTIFTDGSVLYESIDLPLGDFVNIKDLTGNDFELFNACQIVKCGYLSIDSDSVNIRKLITALRMHIDAFSIVQPESMIYIISNITTDYDADNLVDQFEYISSYGIELKIQTIASFCKMNASRKYYEAKCIPFDTQMSNKNSLHVNLTSSIRDKLDSSTVRKMCDDSLSQLMTFMQEINVKCKWIESKLKKPIYC